MVGISFVMMFALLAVPAMAQGPSVLFKEDFNDLKNWKPLSFPKIERHSTYEIKSIGTNHVLLARSDASASGLIYTNTFDVNDYPMLKWRWKVENVYKQGNAKSKKGDDYPIRVYVIFGSSAQSVDSLGGDIRLRALLSRLSPRKQAGNFSIQET